MAALVIAEHDKTHLRGGTANAITAATKMGGEVHVLVAGTGAKGAAEEASKLAGVGKVLHVDAALGIVSAALHLLVDGVGNLVPAIAWGGQAALTGLAVEGAGVDAAVWTLRDGKATKVQMYGGTDEALAAVGLGQ